MKKIKLKIIFYLLYKIKEPFILIRQENNTLNTSTNLSKYEAKKIIRILKEKYY